MATVCSLGLHEPSGLSYLLNESILPPGPLKRDLYTWHVETVYDPHHGEIEEELLTTTHCVLWSQGGILKRVFRLEQEKESIIQAVVTSFPVNETGKHYDRLSGTEAGTKNKTRAFSEPSSVAQSQKRKYTGPPPANPFLQSEDRDDSTPKDYARALVVVLKSQAHIYFLSGDSLVVHIPFEPESAVATFRGLIFQRKADAEIPEKAPSAPPNSFISSQASVSTLRASQSFVMPAGTGNRPAVTVSPPKHEPHGIFHKKVSNLPRLFTLTDPMSEMGLIVAMPNAPGGHKLSSNHPSENYDALNPGEDIVYISKKDEWPQDSNVDMDSVPLLLVVTLNRQTSSYTIWTAKFREKDPLLPPRKRNSLGTGASSRRRSSRAFGFGTGGATTPVARGPSGMRESLDGGGRGTINVGQVVTDERKLDDTDDLASQLGPDFGEIGGSMKNTRRVSSLLARADLGTGHDLTAFSEMVTGNVGPSGAPGGVRRGASLGPYSSRQSQGTHHRRSSAFGDTSILSNGSSFLDKPVEHLLEELNNGGDFEGFENMGLSETMEGLPKELVFARIESFGTSARSHVSQGTRNTTLKPRIFTLTSPFDTSQQSDSLTISICIPETETSSLVLVNLQVQCHQTPKTPSNHRRTQSDWCPKSFTVRVVDMRQGSDVIDACKVSDGEISRMVVMTKEADGSCGFTLQAPWSTLTKIELPSKFMVYDPFSVSLITSRVQRRDGGLKRVISDMSKTFSALQHSTINGQLDLVDGKEKRHRIKIQMKPRNRRVKEALDLCGFVLRGANQAGEDILVAWWEVFKWLGTKADTEVDLEWTAFVVVLFSLGVNFIEDTNTRTPVKQSRRKSKILRSSSSSSVELESWEAMLDQEAGSTGTSSELDDGQRMEMDFGTRR